MYGSDAVGSGISLAPSLRKCSRPRASFFPASVCWSFAKSGMVGAKFSSIDRSPMAAPKWQPARDFGARAIMRMALPIISRASPIDFE